MQTQCVSMTQKKLICKCDRRLS